MGSGGYSYNAGVQLRASAATQGFADTFIHDAKIKTGQVAFSIHESVDPLKMKNHIRESRDSADHPESLPIATFLDVTGSMSNSPKQVMAEFPKLMATIIKDAGVADPHLLFGAIGDADSDQAPFQVSQFEADNRTEEQISNLYLEGNGGGNGKESYDLPLFFLARMTQTDAWEKREQKGFAFIVQDEPPPSILRKEHVKEFLGITVEADIPFADLVKEACAKWNIFILRLQTTGYGADKHITKRWKEYFDECVIDLPTEKDTCGVIATILAHHHGGDLDAVANSMGVGSKVLSDVKSIVLHQDGTIVKSGKNTATGTIQIAQEEAASRL